MQSVVNKEGIRYCEFVTMETIICYKCAIPFAVPTEFKSHLKSSQDEFYCPNGHTQVYTKSAETILREQMEKQRRDHEIAVQGLKNRIEWANQSRDNVIKERTVLKGKLTKIKNRVKNGVCPCCNRSFSNLHNHMKSQHPDYNEETN